MRRLFSRSRKGQLDLEAELAARDRPASFPFVSGDTFRAMCDVVVDEAGVSRLGWLPGHRVFCATKYSDVLLGLVESDADLRRAAKGMTVLVHNGDVLPDDSVFARLLEAFESVHTVNITPELESMGVGALPIGIENLHWGRNGLLEYFPLPGQVEDLPPLPSRRNLIFGSFRSVTNPQEREPLQRRVIETGMTWHDPAGSPEAYFQELRDSVFVLSPRGNGLDCHRTWEALYCGAIPVVTQGTLSRTLTDALPILVVDSWDAVFDRTAGDLMAEAENLSEKSRESAYFPSWTVRFGAK
jgi:hypothetical protein